MAKYLVVGLVTISVHVEVEADSEEGALHAAQEAPMLSLCRRCAVGQPDEWSTSGELDGEVTIATVEEV